MSKNPLKAISDNLGYIKTIYGALGWFIEQVIKDKSAANRIRMAIVSAFVVVMFLMYWTNFTDSAIRKEDADGPPQIDPDTTDKNTLVLTDEEIEQLQKRVDEQDETIRFLQQQLLNKDQPERNGDTVLMETLHDYRQYFDKYNK